MSRNRRRENRRKAREARSGEKLEADLRRLAESGDVQTMTQRQALDMIENAADVLGQRMTHEGRAGQPPWGVVAFDYKALRSSIETSLLVIQGGDAGIDRADDLTDEQALRTMLMLVGGLATMGAASVLWLRSLPLPAEMIHEVLAVEDPSV